LCGYFNKAAAASRCAAYGALTVGIAGAVTGTSLMSLPLQNHMLLVGLAAMGARRMFQSAAALTLQYKRDVYERDYGRFDAPADHVPKAAALYAPTFTKRAAIARTDGKAEIIDLSAIRRARGNSSPSF
jgi:hypothetical protein